MINSGRSEARPENFAEMKDILQDSIYVNKKIALLCERTPLFGCVKIWGFRRKSLKSKNKLPVNKTVDNVKNFLLRLK